MHERPLGSRCWLLRGLMRLWSCCLRSSGARQASVCFVVNADGGLHRSSVAGVQRARRGLRSDPRASRLLLPSACDACPSDADCSTAAAFPRQRPCSRPTGEALHVQQARTGKETGRLHHQRSGERPSSWGCLEGECRLGEDAAGVLQATGCGHRGFGRSLEVVTLAGVWRSRGESDQSSHPPQRGSVRQSGIEYPPSLLPPRP
jgi:hypothetical protein